MVNDKIECYNWANKLEKLSRILVCGKKPNLTIFEKCMIINALAVSKLVFNAPILQNLLGNKRKVELI